MNFGVFVNTTRILYVDGHSSFRPWFTVSDCEVSVNNCDIKKTKISTDIKQTGLKLKKVCWFKQVVYD